MSNFAKYLQHVSDELLILQGDIGRIIATKKEEAKNPDKQEDKQDKQSNFKKIPLKSLQPVTKIYKNKTEILKAKENPEVDFITKQLENIFKQ